MFQGIVSSLRSGVARRRKQNLQPEQQLLLEDANLHGDVELEDNDDDSDDDLEISTPVPQVLMSLLPFHSSQFLNLSGPKNASHPDIELCRKSPRH